MGRKGNWFSAVRKALIPDSRCKKDKKSRETKKTWLECPRNLDREFPPAESEPIVCIPAHSPPKEEAKLVVEKEQDKHAYSMAFATASEVVQHTSIARFSGTTKGETAAIKIQTAFRGYLARRALHALKGLVRLKSLIQGQSVKRQASTTLKCMQTLARVQSQLRARNIRMSEENQILQKHLLHKQDKEFEKLREMGEGWVDSPQTKEQIEATKLNKQEAAVRRERALAYAYSHQKMRMSPSKSATSSRFVDPNNTHWGWSWLERWMAARPWESTSIVDRELNCDPASVRSTTTSRAISIDEISRAHSQRDLNCAISIDEISRAHSQRDLNFENQHSSNALRLCHNPSCQSSSIAAATAAVPSYMAATKSAKAKSRLSSPLGLEKNGMTVDKGSAGSSSKRRLTFPSSSATPVGPRRHFDDPLKLETASAKDITVHS